MSLQSQTRAAHPRKCTPRHPPPDCTRTHACAHTRTNARAARHGHGCMHQATRLRTCVCFQTRVHGGCTHSCVHARAYVQVQRRARVRSHRGVHALTQRHAHACAFVCTYAHPEVHALTWVFAQGCGCGHRRAFAHAHLHTHPGRAHPCRFTRAFQRGARACAYPRPCVAAHACTRMPAAPHVHAALVCVSPHLHTRVHMLLSQLQSVAGGGGGGL